MPDLSIEVNHPDKNKEIQYIHLKGEWYIWECRSLDNTFDMGTYSKIDSNIVDQISKNITEY